MSYSFWRPPILAPGGASPLCPLATPLVNANMSEIMCQISCTWLRNTHWNDKEINDHWWRGTCYHWSLRLAVRKVTSGSLCTIYWRP